MKRKYSKSVYTKAGVMDIPAHNEHSKIYSTK